MDKGKLRIRVSGTNKKFYLQPPAPLRNQPDYFVRCNVPRRLRLTNPSLPKTITRSTGFSTLEEAREKGREILVSIFDGRFAEAEQSKRAMAGATWGEVFDLYKPSPRVVQPKTAMNNISSMELILRESLGKTNVRGERMDATPPEQVLKRWMRLREDRVRDRDLVIQERAAVTINSTLTQARSVFSPKVMELYESLKLPDLAAFRAVRRLRVDQDMSYKPIPSPILDALKRDAALLRKGESAIAAECGITAEEQPKVYRVYLLMMQLGLRNNEVMAARECWIERDPPSPGYGAAGAQLVIKRRPDFVAKNKRHRTLNIDAEVLEELDEHRGLPDAWLINEPLKWRRFDFCNRKINLWARAFLPADRVKGAYEFRKHAGSVVASRPPPEGGIMAAAAFLGDSITITEKHYATYLRSVRGIRSDEISAGRAAA